MSIIGERLCRNCAVKVKDVSDGKLRCRLNPPVLQAIYEQQPVKGPNGQITGIEMVPVGSLSIFPIVQEEWWCGQHKSITLRPELSGNVAGHS